MIDPSAEYDPSLIDGRLKYVLLTHCHFDHVLELDAWASGGAAVVISRDDADALADSELNCYKLFLGLNKGYKGATSKTSDGDILKLGDEQIKVIACPGHTAGSVVYAVSGQAFVGDTVFAGGGYGRFDLPSGDYRKLGESIERLISSLPDDTVMHPGHGASTTVYEFKEDYKYRRIK